MIAPWTSATGATGGTFLNCFVNTPTLEPRSISWFADVMMPRARLSCLTLTTWTSPRMWTYEPWPFTLLPAT